MGAFKILLLWVAFWSWGVNHVWAQVAMEPASRADKKRSPLLLIQKANPKPAIFLTSEAKPTLPLAIAPSDPVLSSSLDPASGTAVSPLAAAETSNFPQKITVDRFEFVGNTALSSEVLTAIVESFTHRPLTFAQLLQAEAAVTQAYAKAGYINSGAVIPANQTLSPDGAVVTIQVIEGGLEEINVSVEGRLSSDYVRDRLALATKKPLNQNRLLEALQLLQLNLLIQTISAELAAGSRPESSVLNVKVIEANTFSLELLADNARIPSVGSFRRGFRLSQANVSGWGDSFSGEYYNTDGSNNFNLRYQIPLNSANGTITLSGGLTDSQIIEPPFNILNITGNSPYVEVSLRQPVIQTPTHELALGITAAYQESSTQLLGFEFPLSPGANAQGITQVSALRVFQEWTQRAPQSVLALRSQFNFGLDVLEATVNPNPPDSRFFDWRGQGQYVQLLAPDTLLLFRSELQFSNNPLLPLEQFALGGLYTVRGYRQDLLLTDNGFFASAELRLPILRVDEGVLQLTPFIDFGVGWNHPDNPVPTPPYNTLLGMGLGLQWQIGNKFSARFDWGIPITGIQSGGNTWQEQGLYFSVNYKLF